MGQSPAGEDCNRRGVGLPLLNGPTEFGDHHPVPTQFTTDPKKVSVTGDILFCVRGSTTGRMNWSDQVYAIGRGIAAVRHRNNNNLQPLMRALIEYNLPRLLQSATGSTFPNVSATQLAGVPFPSLPAQDEIAASRLLGAFDDKIDLNRRMNETLEAIARAIFKDWFVDFGPTRAKMEGRAPYLASEIWALFADRLDDEGKPEGWNTTTVGNIAERIAMGPFGSNIKVETFVDTGVPIISGQHLNGTCLEDNDFNFITDEHSRKLANSIVRREDIVFTHAGNIGQVAIIPNTSRY